MEILNLSKGIFTESTGWAWTIKHDDGRELNYRTNKHFEGLYYWDLVTNSWSQCRGNGQFSLSKHKNIAMRQLKKYQLDNN
jgi:hypothetical protein